MSQEDEANRCFGDLRALLHQRERPRRDVWEDLCELLLAWPSAEHLEEVAIPYVERLLEPWPEEARDAPILWRELLRDGSLPAPLLQLVRTLRLGPFEEEAHFDALLERADLGELLELSLPGWRFSRTQLMRLTKREPFGELEALEFSRGRGSMSASRDDAILLARELGAATAFPCLHRLTLSGWKIGDRGARLLQAGGALRRIGALELVGAEISASGLAQMLEPGSWPSLTHLELRENPLGNEGLATIARWAGPGRLSHLGLRDTVLGADAPLLLASDPAFSGLISLDLSENAWIQDGLARLARAPLMRNLVSLEICHGGLDERTFATLLAGSNLNHLERLRIPGNGLDDEVLYELAGSSLRSLRLLDLNQNSLLCEDGLEALVNSPVSASLEELRFCGIGLPEGHNVFGNARFMTSLRRLILSGCRLTDEDVVDIFGTPNMAKLEKLNLSNNVFGDRALDALAHSMHIRGLRHLDLSRTGITSAGVARLMRSPAVSALVSLDLSETAIDDEALVAIAESNHLGRLRSLSFRHTDVSYKGWQALSSSPNAHYLEQIGVFGSSLSVPGVLELVARSEHLGPWIHRALERAMNPRPAYR